MNKKMLAATGIGMIPGFLLAFPMLFAFHGCGIDGKPAPGPTPDPIVVVKGTRVVGIVDDSAPSIPLGMVIDDQQMKAMKKAGIYCTVSLTEPSTKPNVPLVAELGYSQLITDAGGAPALLFFDDHGECVKPARFPTDRKARDTLFAKYLKNVPPPMAKAAEDMMRVISRGELLPEMIEGLRPYVLVDGHKRFLTAKPDQVKFGALPKYGDRNPLFPQSEWQEINRRDTFGGDDWIYDQDGHGSCVGNGATGALRRVRWLAGMEDVKLAPAFLYAQINGGNDSGAVISDTIAALKAKGVCTFGLIGSGSMTGQEPIYWSRIPDKAKQDAMRFRVFDAYRCDSFEEAASALQTGRYIMYCGVMVGNSFGRFDQFGVCGHDRGSGNHCIMCDGMKKLADGRWVFDMANSWGFSWGAFKNGRAYLDKDHLFGKYGDQPDVCVIRLPTRDPNDKNAPPVHRAKAADADCTLAP